MDGVAFHDPMHEATKKPLTTVAACHCSPYSPGRQSRPHLFHVVRKVCTKSGHVSTIPPVVKNNSHHGISTIKSDYPIFFHESAPLHASPNRPTRQSRNGLFESLPHTEPRKTPGFPLNILGFYLNYGYPLVSYSFTSLIMIPPLSLGETSFGSGLGEDMPLTVLTTLSSWVPS